MEEQVQERRSGDAEGTSPQELIGPRELVEQGRQYYRQGEYEDALVHLRDAYEAFKADGDRGLVAETANDIGVVHTVLRHWDQAERWLTEANRLFVDLEDLDGEAQTLGNLGSLYRSKGDLQQAAANLQLAADRFHVVGDDERRSSTLKVLSMVRLAQFRFTLAVAAYEAALACHPRPTVFHKLLRKLFAAPLRVLRP